MLVQTAVVACMATSTWLAKYDLQKEVVKLSPIKQHHFLAAVDSFILKFSDWKKQPKQSADKFYSSMEREACGKAAGSVGETAARMWTSALQLEIGPGVGIAFYTMINEAMRLDLADMMAEVALINCAMNDMLVSRRVEKLGPATFPSNATSHRGGGFDLSHKDFFSEKKKFRVPHPLATSGDEDVAYDFWRKGSQTIASASILYIVLTLLVHKNNSSHTAFLKRFMPVHWYFHFDERGEKRRQYACKHVMLLENITNINKEVEYLFAAYSVFTVRSAIFPAKVFHVGPSYLPAL